MALYWLSFADPTRPPGQQFLGACLIEATGLRDALVRAHLAGANPGGEVLGMAVPPAALERDDVRDKLAQVPFGCLLDHQQLAALGLLDDHNDPLSSWPGTPSP